MKKTILIILMAIIAACSSNSNRDSIKAMLDRQMTTYPKSELKDIYKNCFQDMFGPGHIISDTTYAANYLRQELASLPQQVEGAYYEPCGVNGNYVRVNLRVITEGILTYDQFFDAFVRSVNGIEPPPVEEWAKQWHQIVDVIQEEGLQLPNFEADKAEIDEILAAGLFANDHSDSYRQHYSPHYRIMSKAIFESEVLPMIQQSNHE